MQRQTKTPSADFRRKPGVRGGKGQAVSFQPLGAAAKKQHGIGCRGKAPERHGVHVVFCGFGAVRAEDIVSLDGGSGIGIGDDDDAGLLDMVFGNLPVPDGAGGHAGIHALEAFGADPALKTPGRLKADLRFAQPQSHLRKIAFTRCRLPLRHMGAGKGGNVGRDGRKIPVQRSFGQMIRQFFSAQAPVHRTRRFPAGSHGLYDRRRPLGSIARGIHPGNAGSSSRHLPG